MLSPQLVHKILVVFFLLPCCVQGKPAGNSLPNFSHLPEEKVEEGVVPGTGSYHLHFYLGFKLLDDNEMEDVHQLNRQISRLERVFRLRNMITAAGGKIFATSGKTADFQTTQKTCKKAGGSIAAPRNASENDAILYLVKSSRTYAYLGIRESLIPTKFQFLDGTPLSYTHWYSGEPAGRGEEECVEMYTDGTWNDKSCYKNRLIVCQF